MARVPLFAPWLRGYKRSWLRFDLVAGLTLAAYLLPAGIGDASIAGLPAQAGLYACALPGLVFWIFCGSRHTAITPTTALSLLIAGSIAPLSQGDPARHAVLAAAAAVLVGAFAFVAWLTRAGAIVSFISETVLLGFKVGIALLLASSQLPKVLGFSGGHGNFIQRVGHLWTHIDHTHALSTIMGVSALVLLALGKKFMKHRPVSMVVLVAAIVVAALTNIGDHGVKLLGHVPQGLPEFGVPAITFDDVQDLLPIALACFLLVSVETAAIGRTFAARHGYRFDSNREFLALAAANVAAGVGQAFPVSGGMSQSTVNESAGAKTPLSGLVAALVALVIAVFAGGLLRNLPEPVLGAIVLIAVVGLVDIRALHRVWRFSRSEFLVAMVALVGVLVLGVLPGVLLGAILSLLLLIGRASRPPLTELGVVPGTTYYADRRRHPENQRQPGVFVFRVQSSLLYFNAEHIRDRFFEMLDECIKESGPVRLVVFFCGTTPFVDLGGAETLADICTTLESRGIELRLAEAHGGVRDALRSADFERHHGPIKANHPVDRVIDEWRERQPPPSPTG